VILIPQAPVLLLRAVCFHGDWLEWSRVWRRSAGDAVQWSVLGPDTALVDTCRSLAAAARRR